MVRSCILLVVMLGAMAHAQDPSRVPAGRNKNGTEVVSPGGEKSRRTPEELEKGIQACDASVEGLLQQLADNADTYETSKAPITPPPRARRGAPGDGYYGSYLNRGAPAFTGGYPGDFGLAGGYGGYSKGYGSRGYLDFDKAHTESPVLTFVKGFRPGKSYIEKGRVVRNYYRHGTYDVALQHYKFIPVIKVVPYTTYNTVGYTDKFATITDYTANICKDCYRGYPKIDVAATKGPYSYLTRRLVYLPETYQIDDHHQSSQEIPAVGGYGHHFAGYPGGSSRGQDDDDWAPGANNIPLP